MGDCASNNNASFVFQLQTVFFVHYALAAAECAGICATRLPNSMKDNNYRHFMTMFDSPWHNKRKKNDAFHGVHVFAHGLESVEQ